MSGQCDEQVRFNTLYQGIAINGHLPFIGRLLQRTARALPHHTALVYEQTSMTYAQLYYYATQLSKKLLDQGIKPRDRVILLFENTPAFYVGYFGILQIGAVVAPLNTFLQERELAHIIEDAQPTMIIVSSLLRAVVDPIAATKNIPLLTEANMGLDEEVPTVLVHFEVTDLPADEMAALLYTSGTTGFPKGVMLSSKNIMTNVLQGITRFNINYTDRLFAVLPLFHSFAQNTCVWTPLFVGCTIIVVPKVERRAIIQGLALQPTIVLGVPALYGLFCLMKTAPLEGVRLFVSGGDALPDRIRSLFALIYRRKISCGYGLTEASPFVAGDIVDELTNAAAVGTPLVGITCLLKDETGASVPQGTIGQLWIKGDNIMLGYYQAPEMTSDVLRDGWLSTGDLAYKDSKGRLVVTGRYKDIIKHKGFIIYPQEVENIIMMHPQVLRVGVIGQEDPAYGEVAIAYVQLKQDDPALPEQLAALCAKNLASYKVPRRFICSSEPLALTTTGKVDKKVLRKLHKVHV